MTINIEKKTITLLALIYGNMTIPEFCSNPSAGVLHKISEVFRELEEVDNNLFQLILDKSKQVDIKNISGISGEDS